MTRAASELSTFGGLRCEAVAALNAQLQINGRDPIDLHVYDLRRSAYYQMRKVGIDSETRRAIMGHKTGPTDNRFTVIEDDVFGDAIDKPPIKRNVVCKLLIHLVRMRGLEPPLPCEN